MYRPIEIWKRTDSGVAIRFFCFQRLADDKVCVQNADYFRTGYSENVYIESLRNSLQLFLEEDPEIRSQWYFTLEEAILAHEFQFSDLPGKVD